MLFQRNAFAPAAGSASSTRHCPHAALASLQSSAKGSKAKAGNRDSGIASAVDDKGSLMRQRFVWPDTKEQVQDPLHWFFKGRKKAKLERVGFHDLWHFRATQWIMLGVDIRTVQGLLGHSNIQTTERYVKFVDTHASKVVIEAQRLEDVEVSAQATYWQRRAVRNR